MNDNALYNVNNVMKKKLKRKNEFVTFLTPLANVKKTFPLGTHFQSSRINSLFTVCYIKPLADFHLSNKCHQTY